MKILTLHFCLYLDCIFYIFSGKGSQGATTGNVDYLDASKSPIASGGGGDTSSPRPGSATSSTQSGPRQQKPGHQQKKKKGGKGGKGKR